MDLSTATKLAKDIKTKILFFTLKKPKIKIVGSILRKELIINDIDLLVIDGDLTKLNLSRLTASGNLGKIIVSGKKHVSFNYIMNKQTNQQIRVDLFTCKSSELPYAMFHYTGNKDYNIRTRAHAKRMGYLLNQYGLFKNGVKLRLTNVKTERDLAHILGLTFRKPSDRK